MDLIGTAERLPLLSETLLGNEFHLRPGGKGANQAVAAWRAGAPTMLLGTIGTDQFGDTVTIFLEGEGLDLAVARGNDPTGVALILVGSAGENMILVVAGANASRSTAQIEQVEVSRGDVVLVQGEIPEDVSIALLRRSRAGHGTNVLNLSPMRPAFREHLADIDYLIVNEIEFAQLLGDASPPMDRAAARTMLDREMTVAGNILVTLGAMGLVARIQGNMHEIPAHRVTAKDTTGAGDCFCGAFAAALATGMPALEAAKFANAAAALSVRTTGAAPSMPNQNEVQRLLAQA